MSEPALRQLHAAERRESGRVLHLVGRITDEVFGFLGPATLALAERGVDQTLVAIDDPYCRRLLPRLHGSVEVRLLRHAGNPVMTWGRAYRAMKGAMAACSPLRAVHLHGFMPSLLAPYAMRSQGVEVPIFHTPHASKALLGPARAVSHMLWWSTRPLLGRPRTDRGVANIATDARRWSSMSRGTADVVESPVAQDFFDVARREAARPLVVTGSKLENRRSAELLSQLAVLMSAGEDDVSFHWIGATEPMSLHRLSAAGVGVADVPDDAERAQHLAAGWLYFAPGGSRGFPLCLVEAMAVGLPCIAMDTPYHRDFIVDGETGFLCSDIKDVVRRTTQLVASRALRQDLGGAAREAARERFSDARFRDSLFAVYDLSASADGSSSR